MTYSLQILALVRELRASERSMEHAEGVLAAVGATNMNNTYSDRVAEAERDVEKAALQYTRALRSLVLDGCRIGTPWAARW